MKNDFDDFAGLTFVLWVFYLIFVALSPTSLNWILFWAFPSMSVAFYVVYLILLKVIE